MKDSLAPGITATRRIAIDRDRTIGFMGEANRVYATPRMISDIEFACRDAILPHLDPGEDTVGTRVEIDHLAAGIMGSTVEIIVRLVERRGRHVVFEASVRDKVEEIGRGRHGRFVVDAAKAAERILAKSAKLRDAG